MAYRSLFMAPDWQHARYLGWKDEWRDPGLRVLTRRSGPFERRLIVSEIADPDQLSDLIGDLAEDPRLRSETIVHDMTGSEGVAARLGQMGFGVMGPDERLLNRATFVIDLTLDEEALLAAMSSDCRRKVRLAEKSGVEFIADAHLDPAAVRQFEVAYHAIAVERGLQKLDHRVTRRMLAEGWAHLYATRHEGKFTHFLLSYQADGTGFFLKGASIGRDTSGAGHALQWGVIRHMKQAGLRWYDMGGLAHLTSEDGIFRFKKGFGGELVMLGDEYRRSGAAVRLARYVRDMFQR